VKHKFEKNYAPDIVTVGYPSGSLDNGCANFIIVNTMNKFVITLFMLDSNEA